MSLTLKDEVTLQPKEILNANLLINSNSASFSYHNGGALKKSCGVCPVNDLKSFIKCA
jgi:hypothetical protein